MWNAKSVSKEIYHILGEKATGSVHSVFNRSFNLIFGNDLIHIGAAENGMAPFGIGIGQMDAQMLIKKAVPGQPVVWHGKSKTLHFSGGEILSLQSASSADHFLPAVTFEQSTLRNNFRYLADKLYDVPWQTGIAATDAEKKRIIDELTTRMPAETESPVIKELRQLQVFINGGCQDAEPVFDYWIGRGAGLTPSGDDILTGVCAAFAALIPDRPHWIEALASYLKQYGEKRTTAVSVAYLSYAAGNQFHSHLIQLMESLLQPDQQQIALALEEMKKMGHTSGTDTMIGVLAGISVILSGDWL